MDNVWEDDHQHKINSIRFEKTQMNGMQCRSEVTPDSGRYGIEYYLSLTKPQFDIACNDQNWMGIEMYDHFTQCLTRNIKTSWKETLKSDYVLESQRTHANWDTAQDKLWSTISIVPRLQMACTILWKPE